MNTFVTEVNALAALQGIVALQARAGTRNEGAALHTFLTDRINFYIDRGLSGERAYVMAQEDRRAQF